MKKDFLINMLETVSVSGFEEPMQSIIENEMKTTADQILKDDMNNIICVRNPRSEKRIMLSAHMDEIGLMISGVTDKGELQTVSRGGIIPHTYPGQHVVVRTQQGNVYGVTESTRALLKKEDLEPADFLIDIGVGSKEEALKLVKIGDPVAPDVVIREMANGRISSRALDDKLGVYIIMEAFKRAAAQGCTAGVYAAATTGEETTQTGAFWCSKRIRPSVAIVVDVTFASDCLGGNAAKTGEVLLGGGPVLCNAPIVMKKLNDQLEACAVQAGIPIQREAASRLTCTDGDKIHFSNDGVPVALVSIPLRYMHTPAEVADRNDIENCIRLITQFLVEQK